MVREFMKFIHFLVTGFYLGYVSKAPGTIGTLLGIPLAVLMAQFGDIFYLSFVLLFIIISVYLVEVYEAHSGKEDAPFVVIDEIAGFLVALSLVPKSWSYIILAFVIFRALDILKPFPISYMEKKIKGGMGVVMDDVACGLLTNVVCQVSVIYF